MGIHRLALALAILAAGAAASFGQGVLTKIDVAPTVIGEHSNLLGSLVATPLPGSHQFPVIGGKAYFTAELEGLGRELYSTDGTAAGTTLVKEIIVGATGSGIREFVAMGGLLYLNADDGVAGDELWVSDGTVVGTQLLADLVSGSGSSSPAQLTVAGGQLFFIATSANEGMELYVSDGTSPGTHLVMDINPGPDSSLIASMIPNPNGAGILLRADDGVRGVEVWSSDGTLAGTQLVLDLEPGAQGAGFEEPVAVGGRVAFRASTAATGSELFVTDGTPGGTKLLLDIEPGALDSDPSLVPDGVMGGLLYLSAHTAPLGRELYVTDGTVAGTSLVADANPGPESSLPLPLGVAGGSMLLNLVADPAVIGMELYRVNGTTLSLVKDMSPGNIPWFSASVPAFSVISNPAAVGGRLYFDSFSFADGVSLWVTDGTTSGTAKVHASSTADWPTPISPTDVVFVGFEPASGRELYRTTSAPTDAHLVLELSPNIVPVQSSPKRFEVVDGDQLYFVGQRYLESTVMFRWSVADGVTQLTENLDLNFSMGEPEPRVAAAWLGDHEDRFFTAEISSADFQLMHTDGTAVGTSVAMNFGTGAAVKSVLGASTTHLFVAVDDGLHGTELWTSDGSPAGPTLLKDIWPGSSGSGLRDAVVAGNRLLFVADDGVHGRELWISDGTSVGTHMVVDLNPTGHPNIGNLTAYGDRALFAAWDGVSGLEPWITDGTPVGTVQLADVFAGQDSSYPVSFRPAGPVAYFFASDGAALDRDVWRTDGTPAGTSKVADVLAEGLFDVHAAVAGGKLFFQAEDTLHGKELWVFDGTTSAMVKDLEPGLGAGHAHFITPVGNHVYFSGTTSLTGNEVFVSDGTAAGTHLAAEVAIGATGSTPRDLTVVGGDLLFSARALDQDRELYRLEISDAHVLELGFGGSGAELTATAPVLGSTAIATVEHAPTGAVGVLALSVPAAPTALLVQPGNASWLSPVGLTILGSSLAQTWSIPISVPLVPALSGLEINAQVWFLPAGTLPASTSNGLRLVLGD